jgi:phosphohistidine phosphatase SixA
MRNARLRFRTLLPVVILTAASAPGPAAEPPRTVILVRHAERPGGMSTDEGISEIGRCRAQALARVLADAGVRRIYTSEVSRTQQTAEPLAARLNIRPDVVPAKETARLVSRLKSDKPGGVALVVGHSNTVPDIIKQLGAGTVPPIADDEFDRLFVVTLPRGAPGVVTLHYAGCPTP